MSGCPAFFSVGPDEINLLRALSGLIIDYYLIPQKAKEQCADATCYLFCL